MAKISKQQELINEYPQFKDEIIEKLNDKETWAKTYIDDTGTICQQWDDDVKITESFKYEVVKMDLDSLIINEKTKIKKRNQKYLLYSGFPLSNKEASKKYDILNENSEINDEQLYLDINGKRVFIIIPLDFSELNTATIIENDGKIYIDGYLAVDEKTLSKCFANGVDKKDWDGLVSKANKEKMKTSQIEKLG